MTSVSQVKQTIYTEMLEVAYNAVLGKYNNLAICQHRAKGCMAYWEIQMLMREKLGSIGNLDEALKELIYENKIEEVETYLYKIKK